MRRLFGSDGDDPPPPRVPAWQTLAPPVPLLRPMGLSLDSRFVRGLVTARVTPLSSREPPPLPDLPLISREALGAAARVGARQAATWASEAAAAGRGAAALSADRAPIQPGAGLSPDRI